METKEGKDEKMKSIRSVKLGLPTIALIVLLTAGAVGATVMLYKDVQISMEIVGLWNMRVFDTDHTTELTAIDFGTLYRGDTKRYPDGVATYLVENTGDYTFYGGWQKSADWPAGLTITIYVNGSPVNEKYVSTTTMLEPGSSFEWYIEITVSSDATLGTHNPVLTWDACDSTGYA